MSESQHAPLDGPLTTSPTQAEEPSSGPVRPIRAPQTSPTANLYSPPPVVRPYAMTGGRTRPRYQLAIEALVSTTADDEQLRNLLPEHQRICLLCREIKSVAEVSALLAIPLGATRLLVADLAEAGLVTVHQPGGNEAPGGPPDLTLLERTLSGLQRLPATDPEQHLADSYKALLDDLDAVVDTEAGLRDALLQPDHDAAIDGLDDVLDVDAGLRDALGEQVDPGN